MLIYLLDVRHVKLPSSIYLLFIKNIYIYIYQQRCGEKPVLNLPEPLTVHDPPVSAALLLLHVQGPTATSERRARRVPPAWHRGGTATARPGAGSRGGPLR